jgi:hypothetical protein
MESEPHDDIDRLYAKLEWQNPRPNFTGRVRARVRTARRIQRISAMASLSALIALGVFAFALGRGLTFSGALDYLGVLVNNLDVVMGAADDFVQALLDVIPWTETIAVLLSIVGVWVASVVLPRWLSKWSSRLS